MALVWLVAKCDRTRPLSHWFDPVYTGQAMDRLMDWIGRQILTSEQTVLFWRTGGTLALVSSAKNLL
jgi:1-aminocyclopropane-1-carboxylate deaminase/D-cysteine desulfhydrase-like pyridoxal-dependent ACC family enzyme